MMQDRLKIRVWDKHDQSYWFQSTIEQNIHWLMNPEEYKDANYPPDCVDIEQCVGLKDKNSKLIYENDFIQAENGNVYLIEWCQEKLGFVARTNSPDDVLESLDISSCEWEVIGNIHENEDLLENK